MHKRTERMDILQQKKQEELKEGQSITFKIKEEFGIEKAKNMTQFTYKELQTEKLNI